MIPCDIKNDLDCYFNRSWKIKHALTDTRQSVSTFSVCQEEIDNELYKAMLNSNDTNLEVFVDSFIFRTRKSESLSALFSMVNRINNPHDLAEVVRNMCFLGISTLFSVNVTAYYTQPKVYCINIGEPLIPPSYVNSYNDNNFDTLADTSADLINMYDSITRLMDVGSVEEWVSDCLLVDLLLSKTMLSAADSNNANIIYNSLPSSTFFATHHPFWQKALEGMYGSTICFTNINHITFVDSLMDTMTPHMLRAIKRYLAYSTLCSLGQYMHINDSNNDDGGLLNAVVDHMGYDLEEYYDRECYSIKKANIVKDLFLDIKACAIDSLTGNTFFDTLTQDHLIKKIKKMEIVVGKQKFRINYPPMGDDFYSNLFNISYASFTQRLALLDKPVNREWLSVEGNVYSFSVNAYYDPINNDIFVPTAMMSGMFLSLDENMETIAKNYGSIGSIIGHEFTHSFDTYGRLFDENGSYNDWWTPDSETKYEKLVVKKVSDHYNKIIVNDNVIDGQLTVSENIADIIGIRLSLKAFIKRYGRDALTRRVFEKFVEGWAMTMRDSKNKDIASEDMKIDVHSPGSVRVSAPLSHLQEYYDIIGVTSSDGNYLSPDNRLSFMT